MENVKVVSTMSNKLANRIRKALNKAIKDFQNSPENYKTIGRKLYDKIERLELAFYDENEGNGELDDHMYGPVGELFDEVKRYTEDMEEEVEITKAIQAMKNLDTYIVENFI